MNYSIHGPVTYINKEKSVAFGVRCAWLEIGGSPYLASLRMDQAKTWEEFRELVIIEYPRENMIWADKNGNIGWQSVGIAPIEGTSVDLYLYQEMGVMNGMDICLSMRNPIYKNPLNGFLQLQIKM